MLFSNISDVIIQASKSPQVHSTTFENEHFKIIDQALKEVVDQNFFNYVGDFENPFKKSPFSSNTSSESSVTKVTTPDHIQLKLKGILSNERSLAILEDNEGRTFIRGVGDSVESQRICAISGSVVTILDGKKKYEITVKEE
jgi:hypothetical protein